MGIAFSREMLVAGGGIGGLAAALACTRAGWRARVFEGAPAFADVGAGLQLGPNATRLLHGWGLEDALAAVACFPRTLEVRNAGTDGLLGSLPLGQTLRARYGAPYATLHRADLHALLLGAVRDSGEVSLHLNTMARSARNQARVVTLSTRRPGESGAPLPDVEGDGLLVADGLWSRLRSAVVHDSLPRVTGHVAYRTLVPQSQLPEAQRSDGVTVWLGPRLHALAYPVRAGAWLNLVVLAEAPGGADDAARDPSAWNAPAQAEDVQRLLAASCARLNTLREAAPQWQRWVLCDRRPLLGPDALAKGRIALLGDAGHPMLPYLAQGAAMALEDAAEVQRVLAMDAADLPHSLRRYAMHRWERVARVQAQSLRNGRIFHARGLLRHGRDLGLRLFGDRLLDQPWLWGA